MGIFHPYPFLGRLLNHVLDLVIMGPLAALHQDPGIGFVLQNADHRARGPLRVGAIGVPARRMGQSPAVLIGQRGKNAQPVQFLGDLFGAGPVDLPAKNVLHHPCGLFVDHKTVPILRVLPIPVNWTGPYIIAIFPFDHQGASRFHGNVMAVCVVYDILHAHREIVPDTLMGGVNAVVDGDKPHPVGGKDLP